jgi:hypothetical protein
VAEVELKLGAKLDLLNKHELDDSLASAGRIAADNERQRLAGIKPVRFIFRSATPATFPFGGDVSSGSGGQLQGPEQGYVWSLRLLVIEGMAAGAPPDVINILRGARIIWQLNGNSFGQTWGRGEQVLYQGETLSFQNVGAFASASQVVAHGLAENVPAELIGKFY